MAWYKTSMRSSAAAAPPPLLLLMLLATLMAASPAHAQWMRWGVGGGGGGSNAPTVSGQAAPSLVTVASLFQLEMSPACVADGRKWVVVGARADAPGVSNPGVDRVVFCYSARDAPCKDARYCCARYNTKRECEAALPTARDRRPGNWASQLTCGQRMCLFTGESGFDKPNKESWCEKAWNLFYGGRPPACACDNKAPRGPAPICVRDPSLWA